MEIKPLPPKSLDVFCDIFDFSHGQADITCPATEYRVSCLAALERRGLIVFDTERVHGKNKRWAALTGLGAHYGCEGLALAQVPEAQAPRRNRIWLKVQFDMDSEDYQKAYQIAGELAKGRKLAPTIRDLLLHGIPETKETQQFESMFSLMARMQDTIDELTEKIKSQNTPQSPVDPSPHDLEVSTQGNAPRVLTVKQFSAPPLEDEDDEDLLTVNKDLTAGARASQNFLNSLMSLQEDTQNE